MPARLLAALAAAGLTEAQAARAVLDRSPLARLHRTAPLRPAERQRLLRLAALAAEVAAEGASGRTFWAAPMPWFGGRTPAQVLADRDGLAAVEDVRQRMAWGIPP